MAEPSKTEPGDVPALGDILDFMRLLWAVDHGLHSTSKRMNTSIGVTGPQRLVLRMTGKFPGSQRVSWRRSYMSIRAA
jgi:hypothetical protein